jgi:transposase
MIVAGVDCHKDTHTIVFLNELGQVEQELSIPATPRGYAKAVEASRRFGEVRWGLEGTGSYGALFAQRLVAAGATVYEVPGAFTKRHRQHESRRGKSDSIDAKAIAEAVLRESERLPLYGAAVEQQALRLQYDRRDRLVGERTKAVNRLHHAALRLGIDQLPERLTTTKAVQQARLLARRLAGTNPAIDALVDEICEACEDIERCTQRVRQIERLLRPFVKRLAPELLTLKGISTVGAAGLIGHAGNLRNCRSAAAFAMRSGTAPVPCSSGRHQALRVNYGGDRQLNRILHVIALTQVRYSDHAGRLYYERKRSEGKTHAAAFRALKRQLATVAFYRLKPCHQRLCDAESQPAA